MADQEQGVNQSEAPIGPPAWAQELLPWLVREDREENITGDLLEEYTESVLPERGRDRANRWYVRQVLGFLWRLSWVFAVLIALQIVARTVADTIAAPESYQLRSSLSSWGAVYAYLIASMYGGWRTHRMVGGVLVAIAAHVIGSCIAIVSTVGLSFAVISRDATSLHLFGVTGGWGELFGVPVVVTPIVLAIGVVGGGMGQLIAGWHSPEKPAVK